jgi:hypothetical protein
MIFKVTINYTDYYLPKNTPMEVIGFLLKARRRDVSFAGEEKFEYLADSNRIEVTIVADNDVPATEADKDLWAERMNEPRIDSEN